MKLSGGMQKWLQLQNLLVPLIGLAGGNLLSHGARTWLNVTQFSVHERQNDVRNEK